jgi:DUF971 family protein
MNARPVKLELRGGDRLAIDWSDGAKHEIKFSVLRSSCPCATCREKRAEPPPPAGGLGGLPVLSLAEARPLSIIGMKPVGNYAYGISFSDGHDTGIYTLEYLRELGDQASQ